MKVKDDASVYSPSILIHINCPVRNSKREKQGSGTNLRHKGTSLVNVFDLAADRVQAFLEYQGNWITKMEGGKN